MAARLPPPGALRQAAARNLRPGSPFVQRGTAGGSSRPKSFPYEPTSAVPPFGPAGNRRRLVPGQVFRTSRRTQCPRPSRGEPPASCPPAKFFVRAGRAQLPRSSRGESPTDERAGSPVSSRGESPALQPWPSPRTSRRARFPVRPAGSRWRRPVASGTSRPTASRSRHPTMRSTSTASPATPAPSPTSGCNWRTLRGRPARSR